MTVGLSILRNAVRDPESTAIFGSAELTYGQLDKRTNKIAHYLKSTLKKGDRVALFVANRPEVVEVIGGVAKSGCVYVGLNFRLGDLELQREPMSVWLISLEIHLCDKCEMRCSE